MEILGYILLWVGIFLFSNVFYTSIIDDSQTKKDLKQTPLYALTGLDIPLLICYGPTVIATAIVTFILGIRIIFNFF